jgi:hypothetical protein
MSDNGKALASLNIEVLCADPAIKSAMENKIVEGIVEGKCDPVSSEPSKPRKRERERPWLLNLNTTSIKTIRRLLKVDAIAVEERSPDDYLGLAYFWSLEYKHCCRSLSEHHCKRLFREFIEAGLEPNGDSPEHTAIVDKYWQYVR